MSLLAELNRRKVIKVAGAYLVLAWLAVQAASIGFPAFDAPAWALRIFILIALLGFPVVVVLTWMIDLTPEGVKLDADASGGKRIFAIAALLIVLALGWYFYGQPSFRKGDVATPVAASNNSVAVLPFANMSGKPEEDYFSDGMTEELLNVLARQPQLKVVARTSVFEFKGKGGDVRAIGRKLGVSHIVEGSVRRDGQQVRITVQLIRVSDGFHVWSETFDRKPDSLFAVQDEIARRVAGQLTTSLGGVAPIASREQVDPQAYDDFLKGRALYRERRNVLRAIAYFKSAVARAPKFAEGWANLSLAYDVVPYTTTFIQQLAAGDRLAGMRTAAERATALAPDAAMTLHAAGNVARAEGRFLDAERLYLQSIASDPTYPDVREDYCEFLYSMGKNDAALAASRELVKLEPFNVLFWNTLTVLGIAQDRNDLLDEAVARALELNPESGALRARFRRDLAYGRIDSARREIERAYTVAPDPSATALILFRWSQGEPGIDDLSARQVLLGAYGDYALFAAARGDADLYFAVLNVPRNRDRRFYNYTYLELPIAARYLVDPRAKKLLRDGGFEAYWRAKGWPALCRPIGDTDFECKPASASAPKT